VVVVVVMVVVILVEVEEEQEEQLRRRRWTCFMLPKSLSEEKKLFRDHRKALLQ
jgi:hypothetical protein